MNDVVINISIGQETVSTIKLKAGWDLTTIEEEIILACLKHNNWIRTYACDDLGMAIRTFRNRLNAMRRKGYEIEESGWQHGERTPPSRKKGRYSYRSKREGVLK